MLDIRRVISIILRIPFHLFIIGSFGASIYAAVNKIQGITWGTPILLGVIIAAWYIGVGISRSAPLCEGVMAHRSGGEAYNIEDEMRIG